MKKTFVFAAICAALFMANSAKAQLGINAGYLNNKETNKIDYKLLPSIESDFTMNGFYLGVDYNINLKFGLGIDLGVNFEYLGGSKDEGATLHERFTGISIPILANYKIDLGFGKVGVFVGPNFGIGLSNKGWFNDNKDAKIDYYGDDNESLNLNDNTVELGYDRLQFGLTFGAAVQIFHYRINVAYTTGLNNVAPDKYQNDISKMESKSNNLIVGVGYVF
ncbi:MAG: PorT family protein [Bacteroidales bacterium]|nr:PorT family protein [Candidatus Colimorpha onthohippi]